VRRFIIALTESPSRYAAPNSNFFIVQNTFVTSRDIGAPETYFDIRAGLNLNCSDTLNTYPAVRKHGCFLLKELVPDLFSNCFVANKFGADKPT
jgi:hypothetical protein